MPRLFEPEVVQLVKMASLGPKSLSSILCRRTSPPPSFFFILHAGMSPPPRTTVDEPSCRHPKSSLEQSLEPAMSLVLLTLSIFFSLLELDGFFHARLASMPQPNYVAPWQLHLATVAVDSIGNAISYTFAVFCSIFFTKCVRRFLPFAQMCSHQAFNPSLCFCSCFFKWLFVFVFLLQRRKKEGNIGTARYGSMYWHKLIGEDESVMV